MKLHPNLFIAALIATVPAVDAASSIPKPPRPPSVSVFKGPGIAAEVGDAPSVSLDIISASSSKNAVSPGGIVVSLRPDREASYHRSQVDLNIYSVDADGVENLILELVDVPGKQARYPGAPSTHGIWLDDSNIFPTPLKPGSYRAEAILTVWTPPIIELDGSGSQIAVSDPKPIEAGGAALNFHVSELFLVDTSDISGHIAVSAQLVITNPRQAAQARAAATQLINSRADLIRSAIKDLNFPLDGVPAKKPVSTTETLIPGSGGVNGVSFSLQGQLYTDLAVAQVGRLRSLETRPTFVNVPGGRLFLGVKAPVSFSPSSK
jgi:hypothetical protein